MEFTPEHIRILKKNRVYYETLKASGSITRLSSVITDELQKVYSEAVRDYRFNKWCSSCVVDLIESVYLNYDKYLQSK